MRIGLVGYGNGGRYFHAPYIVAAKGVELAGVVVRNPARRAQLAVDYPGVKAYGSLAEILAAGVEAVVITTPPETRRDLVLQAVAGGVHVVADKPFAPDAAGARELIAAAKAAGVALNVFHNRRWDADLRTLAAVMQRGELGKVWRIESRFDQDQPGSLDPGPHGGALRDLGAHLVDQLLFLLGPARTVHAQIDWVDLSSGRTDAGFSVQMRHASGACSLASASKLNKRSERELRAYGARGCYVGQATDAQTAAIFAGRRPLEEGARWGFEPESALGILRNDEGERRVPSERGAYQDYYTQFASAVRGEGPFPVPAEEGLRTIEVLDAARQSDLARRVVELG
jgi:predicted dehydrogenase